ncbi:hypothetical protein AX14_010862, partial [Amanita brunnescens Koide BX004]
MLANSGQANASTRHDSIEACRFCDVSAEKGFEILWENDKYVAFKDHKPACRYHFLVVPKKHIGS